MLTKILFLKRLKKLISIKQYKIQAVKILKENADFFADYIHFQFNEVVDSSKFADFFKYADILAAYKLGSRNKKENYRPISILPLISKIFEKIICRQLSNHLVIFSHNFSVVLEKVTAHNIVSF